MLERDPQEAVSESEKTILKFVVRAGIPVIVIGGLSLSGLLITFSSEASLRWWGWETFRFGLLGVFLLMDLITARIALWAWSEHGLISWSMIFLLFGMLTFGVIAGLFLGFSQLRDALFYIAVAVFLMALLVQAIQERRRRKSSRV